MSNNLYCKIDNKEIRLWQTPTRITAILLVNENGELDPFDKLTGNDAKRVRWAYMGWVWNRRNEVTLYHYDGTSNRENYDNHRKHFSETGDAHIKEIKDLMKNCKTIEVWSM